jgi:tricorn protease
MLANLTVGHQDAWGPDFHKSRRFGVGFLGADYAAANGKYCFTRIYETDPWNPSIRAPLGEPGTTVATGEYLLAIDGRDVDASVDVYSYFENTAGKQVRLKVGPSPGGDGARELQVVPVEDEYQLRHYAWVERNRSTVDKLSGGRVAYIYVPDCVYAGYKAFNRYFFAQIGKEAAIIDDRYNSGGNAPGYIIDCLSRPLLNYWHTREGRDTTSPTLSIFGPKVMLINEMACSCGEALPWMFRRAGLGPLVGKRTWGGLVGHYLLPTEFADGGGVCAPNLAFYSPDGEWDVENRGVSPDFEVEDDPRSIRNGRDPQLEKAVEVVMDLLNQNPRPSATRPAYPRYQGTK